MSRCRVAVIGTGGTISSVGRDALDLVAYSENNEIYDIDELLQAFPETTGWTEELQAAQVAALKLQAWWARFSEHKTTF